MSLADLLQEIQDQGVAAFAAAETEDAVEEVRIALLGRQGRMKEAKDAFKAATPDEKRTLGRVLGQVDQALKDALNGRLAELRQATDDEAIDITLPADGGPSRKCSSNWSNCLGSRASVPWHGI